MTRQELITYLTKPVSRKVTGIVTHCSASEAGALVDVNTIDRWHKERGFKRQPTSKKYCGYHFIIKEDGEIQKGRDLQEIGAHVAGSNSETIGVVYTGGLEKGKSTDTRTPKQKDSLLFLLRHLVAKFPESTIMGHRDYSPDKDGDGIIEPWEFMKDCPCFDAKKEYENI